MSAPESCETCPLGSAREGRETMRDIRERLTAIDGRHNDLVKVVASAADALSEIKEVVLGNGKEGLSVAMVRAKDRLGLLIWIFGAAVLALVGNVVVLLTR